MAKIVKNYDLKNHNTVTIGGVLIGGYGEDGGIEYEYDSDQFEYVVGADGEVTVSAQNNFAMIVTVTLMETSKSISELEGLRRTQLAAAAIGPILPMPWLHIDRRQLDSVVEAQAVFLDRPAPSKTRNAGERQFRILLPYAAGTMLQGLGNPL